MYESIKQFRLECHAFISDHLKMFNVVQSLRSTLITRGRESHFHSHIAISDGNVFSRPSFSYPSS